MNYDTLSEEEKEKFQLMEAVLFQDEVAQKRRPITEEEARQVLEFPKILDVLIEEIGRKVVGETDTIKTILLSAFGSLVENSEVASYNLLVNSESGSGKDFVVYNTLKILPKDRWIKRTRISPNVFTYWHNPKFEPEWSWNGKTLYLEDVSDNVLNSEVFKVMCSSGSNATILIKQTPVDIEIKGKPVMIITSANASPSPEITRRFTIVSLDETEEQTDAIIRRQAESQAYGSSIEYDKNLVKSLEILKPIKVKIPYADILPEFMPKKSVIMRTHFSRFLDIIKSSTALHQYQREQDNGYYIADGQDYDIAREVLLKMTSNSAMIPLTHNDRKLLEVFETLPEPTSEQELEGKVSFLERAQLFRTLNKLTKYDFLQKSLRENLDDSRKNCMVWSLKDSIKASPLNIPTWKEIEERIAKR